MADKKAKDEPKQDERAKALNDTGTADTVGKTIDERMAALLEDHKKMGAR